MWWNSIPYAILVTHFGVHKTRHGWRKTTFTLSIVSLQSSQLDALLFVRIIALAFFSLFSSIFIITLVHKNKLQSFTSALIILFHRLLVASKQFLLLTLYHFIKTKLRFHAITFKWSVVQSNREEEQEEEKRKVRFRWLPMSLRKRKCLFACEGYHATPSFIVYRWMFSTSEGVFSLLIPKQLQTISFF
jgi:hypothetical protein